MVLGWYFRYQQASSKAFTNTSSTFLKKLTSIITLNGDFTLSKNKGFLKITQVGVDTINATYPLISGRTAIENWFEFNGN